MFRRAALVLCIAFASAGVSVQAQTRFVYDTFTGTTGTFLESHAPDTGGTWTRVRGGGIAIVSNTARPDRNQSNDIYVNSAAAPSAEYVVGISVTFAGNNADNIVELYARGNVALSTGYGVTLDALGNYRIVRYVSGVSTVLASGTTSTLNPRGTVNEIIFFVTDAAKRLIVNGTIVATTTDNTITAAGVAGFGLVSKTPNDAIGDNFYASTLGPTAVRMDSMRATRDGNHVVVSWTTGAESGNLGYRVWRDRVLITPSPVAGSAFSGNATGATYQWIDRRAFRNATYWIEELGLNGKSEWHGPIEPAAGRIDPRTLPASTFGTLAQREGVVRDDDTLHELRSDVRTGHFDVATRDALKISVTVPGIHEVPLPAGADAKRVQVWEDGRELPVVVTNGAVRFYGRPLDSPWSAARVYWMTWDRGAGARMSAAPRSDAPLHAAPSFTATVERREKLIFAATLDSEDGDNFFGPLITLTPARQTLRLESIDRAAPGATLALTVHGASAAAHRIGVTLNGHAAGVLELDGRTRHSGSFRVDAAWLREGDNEIVLAAQNGWEDVSVVEAVRLTYSRRYRASNGALVFTAPGGTRVPVSGFTGDVTAIDVTNPAAPLLLASEGGAISVPGSGTRTIVAADRFQSARITANEPSDLTRIKGGDLAIAPRAFLRALAGRSAVAVEDVYDEFSYGAKDPAAIRAFLEAVRPRSVLLAGDGSFDPRGYAGGAAMDVIPVKMLRGALQRSPSDAWFTDFDGDGAADIAIGRLPARSPEELRAMLAKRAPGAGDVVFVNGAGFAERSLHATAYVDVDGEGITAARQNLLQRWSQAALVDFTGHGSVGMWQSGSFFSTADAASLTHAPLVVAMTCLNGYFHDIYQDSLAESLLRNPDGGAAAVWALSTLTEARGQAMANAALVDALLRGATFGEATMAAQRATSDADVRRALVLFGDPAMKMPH